MESKSRTFIGMNVVRLAGLTSAILAVLTIPLWGASGAAGSADVGTAVVSGKCPVINPSKAIPSVRDLRQYGKFEARLGLRATGSPSHQAFVKWIGRKMGAIDGVKLKYRGYPINRWSQKSASLKLHYNGRTTEVPIAAPIPYAKGTGRAGVTKKLAYVPPGEEIDAGNSAGRIVIRQAPPGSIPLNVFGNGSPLVWWTNDPGNTFLKETWSRDFLAYDGPRNDLENAADVGAAGLLFIKPLPRRQVRGFYGIYEGLNWKVPGFYLGADEGKLLTDAVADGTATASLKQIVRHKRMVTRQLSATLPGRRKQLMVVNSHTDGTNLLEDNGPLAMIAMARYLAKLPKGCRPRSVQFEFSTAHFYQHLVKRQFPRREGGAEQAAQRLDRQYDKGKVAAVLVLEHLGAKHFEPVPRPAGLPGNVLKPAPLAEISLVGVSESPDLLEKVESMVKGHGMRRTVLLRGSDGANPEHVPLNCSFGGEGTPFERHLLPTVSTITAPAYLFNPSFGIEAVNFRLMRKQTVAYTDLLMAMSKMSRASLAGAYTGYRQERAEGKPTCFDQAS